jgi:hypothetical protein
MNTQLSERPLPALHGAALETHLVVNRWLAAIKLRDSAVSRIKRLTRRASIAIDVATNSQRSGFHLRRAREAILECRAELRILRGEEKIDQRLYDHARRRLDQIIGGIDQLSAKPEEQWFSVELAPLEVEANEPTKAIEFTRLQQILGRVEKAVLSLFPGEPPRREAESEGPSKKAA